MTSFDSATAWDIDKLLSKTIRLAGRFPWKPVSPAQDDVAELFRFWNRGFVRGARSLAEAVQILEKAGHHEESFLPLRSLIELVGNQSYMSLDPGARARRFLAEDLSRRGQLIDSLKGQPTFPSADVEDLLAALKRARREQAHFMPNEPLPKSVYPFALTAEKRARSAVMKWHYQYVYTIASDYSHANARAISEYMKPGRVEQMPSSSLLAIEFLLRCLYFADAALKQWYTHVLDSYARDYADLALPAHDRDEVLVSLRPPAPV